MFAVFNYVPYFHNVLHVTKEDYDSCTTTSPLQSDSGGLSITEPLKKGVWYFICGAPGHCEIGMKLKAQTIGYSGSDDSPSPPSETSKPLHLQCVRGNQIQHTDSAQLVILR